MNVGYKHTPYNYKSSTASGLIVSKGPLFPQKHCPAKFSGYVLGFAPIRQIRQTFPTSKFPNIQYMSVYVCIIYSMAFIFKRCAIISCLTPPCMIIQVR